VSCFTKVAADPFEITTVESLAFAVADPAPAALTWFTCGDVALAATFTVAVIAG
jgi:hypothetical protein